ncbi:hypothetical protein FACS1894181_06950 [Bacteroidia bacterium]|nr:hypothetical protein FACS1894181_06950 [Bacteroidia bacterium]
MNKYPTYKPSNIPWLGDVPEHWSAGRIKQLFQVIGSGTTPIAGTPKYYDNGIIPWVNTGDLNDGELYECKKKITQIAFDENSPLKLYEVDTLLIAMYGATIGKAAILRFEACTNQACCALSKSKIADSKFVFYWFIANKQNIIDLSYGGGQPNISQEIIRNLKLPLPPLPEQTQIVRYLDWQVSRINKLISAKKKQIALLKEQKQGVINEAGTKGGKGWKNRRLKQVVTDVNEKSSPKGKFYIGMENIVSWNSSYIPTDSIVDGDSKVFQQGDILFGKLRPYLAKVFLTENEGVCSSEFLVLRGFSGHLPFLKYLLLSYDFIMLVNASTYGAKMPRASWDFIGNCRVAIPPIEEQQAIVAYLEKATAKIDLAIANAEREIALFNEYRTRLISDIVTGKVDVRGEVVPEYIEENREDSTFVDSSREEDDDNDDDDDNNNYNNND